MWIGQILAVAMSFSPAPQDEGFTIIEKRGHQVSFLLSEVKRKEAELILDNFTYSQEAFERVFSIELPFTFKLTLRLRSDSKRYYYTNGEDEIHVVFPNAGLFRPMTEFHPRVMEIASYTLMQLFVHHQVSYQAGLDPDIIKSLAVYLTRAIDAERTGDMDSLLGTPGEVWEQFDTLYGSGTSPFIVNTLLGERLPGHVLGAQLRSLATESTEDPGAGKLIDLICPVLPFYGKADLEPGETLAPETPLRQSRVELFNGARIIDQVGEGFPRDLKVREFDNIFDMVTHFFPDRSVATLPPELNSVPLWETYFEFRARVEQSVDNVDYFLVLREFFSRFHDRTLTIAGPQGTADPYGVVGMSLLASGDQIYVQSVTEESAPAQQGVRAGFELVEIDGRPVHVALQALADYLYACMSCASENEATARALNLLLTGNKGSEAHLRLIESTPEGPVEHVLTFVRERPKGARKEFKLVETELREDGVAVITVNAFFGNATALFSAAIDESIAKQAKGLVVDLRGADGDPRVALTSLGRVVRDEVSVATVVARSSPMDPIGVVHSQPVKVQPLPNVRQFEGPAAVLVDAWTTGAAELFALGFQHSGRGPVIGTRTAGAVNQPVQPAQPQQTLSVGIRIALTQHQVLSADGNRLQGVGMQPDVPFQPRPEQVAAGVDGALETAIELLQK